MDLNILFTKPSLQEALSKERPIGNEQVPPTKETQAFQEHLIKALGNDISNGQLGVGEANREGDGIGQGGKQLAFAPLLAKDMGHGAQAPLGKDDGLMEMPHGTQEANEGKAPIGQSKKQLSSISLLAKAVGDGLQKALGKNDGPVEMSDGQLATKGPSILKNVLANENNGLKEDASGKLFGQGSNMEQVLSLPEEGALARHSQALLEESKGQINTIPGAQTSKLAHDQKVTGNVQGNQIILPAKQMEGPQQGPNRIFVGPNQKQGISYFQDHGEGPSLLGPTKNSMPMEKSPSIMASDFLAAQLALQSVPEGQIEGEFQRVFAMDDPLSRVDSERLIERIAHYITKKSAANMKEINLVANHHDLGKFRINIAEGADGVQIRVTVFNENGADFFSQGQARLLSGLGKSGILVQDFKIEQQSEGEQSRDSLLASDGRDKDSSQEQRDSQRRRKLWDLFHKEAA